MDEDEIPMYDFELPVKICRVTDDAHPYAWKWFYSVNTPYGLVEDSGLSLSRDAALYDAAKRFEQTARDKRTQRLTATVDTILVTVDWETA